MYELDTTTVYGQEVDKGEYYEHPNGLLISIEGYQDDVGDYIFYASVDAGNHVQTRAYSTDSAEVAVERLLAHLEVADA